MAIIKRAIAPPTTATEKVSWTPLKQRLHAAKAAKLPQVYSEVDRVVNLPIDLGLAPDEAEVFQEEHILASAYEDGFRLFDVQVNAVAAYEDGKGLFAPIGVGWGKTLITLMVAQHAFVEKGLRKIMLCVPSQVYAQLMDRDLAWARKRVPLSVPIIGMGNLPMQRRKQIATGGRKGLYVLPYSCLSTKDASRTEDYPGTLFAISPQLVILDEAHLVKSRQAARTRRLRDYLTECEPEVVALSGTITSKSVKDYHYLLRASLKKNCPLPLSVSMSSEWGQIIDSDAAPSERQTGPLRPVIRWAREHFPEYEIPEAITGFRRAYRLRLASAPGVEATGDADIGVSLIISNQKQHPGEGAAELKDLIDGVQDRWLTPDGDEIEYAIHTFKWLYELNAGFYNSLFWPEPEVLAKRRGIGTSKAGELITAAKRHHVALQSYHRVLRGFLENPPDGLDTPMLAGASMAKWGGRYVGPELYGYWSEAKSLEVEGMPERDSESIRVAPFKAEAAVRWAAEHRNTGGLIWVYNIEMGIWISELLKEAGIDHLHCPSGEQHNRTIADPANGEKIVVASLTSHGTGKNLQHFQHQIYVQWPRPAPAAEQSLGRTHRNGQLADELVVHTLNSSEFDYMTFGACLNDALYIHQSTGTRQKLIYCTYDPMPRIYSPEFLRERGFENRLLTAEQRRLLDGLFGEAAA